MNSTWETCRCRYGVGLQPFLCCVSKWKPPGSYCWRRRKSRVQKHYALLQIVLQDWKGVKEEHQTLVTELPAAGDQAYGNAL